ncbi:hypothetical protein GWI33_019542 [Rhynchophorus ferrugineus]|uniref:Transmembrane channel-like protein 7 n=1 Tax=Rhynchophorus ferrugineus TaxID=354439 RepID=A0A834M575_RHYFE|nr:hypothetical protein GWI33_019542 [Rhynchophorus ferrugineus]
MSGGEKKKKGIRSQGWEEAGSEFYQESYPGDSDFEGIWNDPKRLATLLPSKQNRAATTIRLRTNDSKSYKSTVRRHTNRSRRDSTVLRRASAAGEVEVAMLPDLSEMRSNEQTAWEDIMGIKAWPIPMSKKREEKAKIMSEQHLRLQGLEQFNWKRRKAWQQFRIRLLEIYHKIELWRGELKNIEALAPVAFTLAELEPSESCGPFRNLPSIWSLVDDTFQTAPGFLKALASFLTTPTFIIPLFIVLVLLLYYYTAVNSANRHMVTVLKNQLVLEGHDKKFLIDRLYMFIKQENDKRARIANRMTDGDVNPNMHS